MFVRLTRAAAITLALYGLLCLNSLKLTTAENSSLPETAVVEPTEALVALKQALIRRQ